MEPHLYLNRGKKRVLLVRYFDKLHFVTLDHRMNYKVRPWFLEEPRTEEEMAEKGLVRESIPLKSIRGVAAGGTGRGMVVQFYLKEGKRRFELSKDCDLSDMGALFEGLESFDPPKKDSNWHDPRLAKQNPKQRNILWAVGWLLNLTAIITGVFIWTVGYEIPWLCWISLLCIPVSLLLYGFFPDYYNIFSEKPKYGQKKGVRSLVAPLVCPMGMILGAMFNYTWFGWWKGWLFGAVGVAALAAILYFLTPVFRTWDQILAMAVLGLLLSIGPALMLNVIAETVPARNIRTEVVGKESHYSTKGGDYFELIVMLDGEKTGIPVGGETYRTTKIGEIVIVEYHEGTFDIPYAKIQEK